MKKETYERANEINLRMEDIDQAIRHLDGDPKEQKPVISFSFCYEDEKDAIAKLVMNHLKNRKKQLQKSFDSLK